MRHKLSPEKKKEYEDKQKKWANIFGTAFSTIEGKQALRYIMRLCGWTESVVGANPDLGMDIDRGTIYNAARRNVYMELRRFIPDHILKEIEFKPEE